MKHIGPALLVVVALVLGAYMSPAPASDTPPAALDYLEDCVVAEQSTCAQRCLTEHNCCIKSCNWVEQRAKSKCIKHCKSILDKCYRECAEKPAADKLSGSVP